MVKIKLVNMPCKKGAVINSSGHPEIILNEGVPNYSDNNGHYSANFPVLIDSLRERKFLVFLPCP